MTIDVRCPNGHRLRVAAEHAGKSGRCRHCRARVRVPRIHVSEDDILGILGSPPKCSMANHTASGDEMAGNHADRRDPTGGQIGQADVNPSESSALRRQKFCSNCGRMTSFSFKWCPGCGQLLGERPAIREEAASE